MQQYNLIRYYNNFNLNADYSGERKAISYKVIPNSLIKRGIDLITNIKNNKLQSNSTVWFSPFTEFPLYKFNDYVETSKSTITRSKKLTNTVDTIILNDAILDKYYISKQVYRNSGVFYVLDKQFFTNHIQQRISTSNRNTRTLTEDYILIGEDQITNIPSALKAMIKTYPTVEGIIIGNEWGHAKAFQYAESFEQIINEHESNNINIVLDTQINSDTNSGLEFDKDLFSTLLDMISNNDEGNVNIAREIIANTDLNKSRPYILFLFQLYPGLARQNNTRSWKYVVDQFKDDKNRVCYDHLQLFISTFGSKYPEHIPTIFELMAVYFNKTWKKEIIKGITVI